MLGQIFLHTILCFYLGFLSLALTIQMTIRDGMQHPYSSLPLLLLHKY